MYEVVIERQVFKDLDKIPAKEIDKIYLTIKSLTDNPRSPKSAKLKGRLNRYRIRAGDYRVVYLIDDKLRRVYVIYVRHRREVYRKK